MLGPLKRLWRRTASSTATVDSVPAAPPPTLDAEVAAAGLTVAEWCRVRRTRAVLYADPSPSAIESLRTAHADRVRRTIDAAERILGHEFDLLGSGAYRPIDPDRPARGGYQPIDWSLDPVRRLRFPLGVPHKAWNLMEMRPGRADIKYPWELARCQHWATLGQAFALTHDERFAREIARELDDFVEANPVGVGVNWTCTMDVGLRVVSWAIGLELVRGSAALDDAFWMRAFGALFDHGVFIRNNLENTYEVTSNHFLSNLLGLLFLGAVFADLAEGAAWNAFARGAIEHEMTVQVLADGADYESSIPYHRLVTELFLGAARLADHRGAPLSAELRRRLRDMVAYLAAVARPDGLMPQVGDADDGRLHVFEGYASTSPQDARHLFGPAGAMFDAPEWRAVGGEAGAWEAAWWGFDRSVRLQADRNGGPAKAGHYVLFPQAGVGVMRNNAGDYLLVTNGIVGTNGFGNHKHNDQLSFEYHGGGTPLIVDPGSYVYTSDPEARNRFRSTASHNTLALDGVEQNDMRADWLFRMFETAHAETVSFNAGDDLVEYVGRHRGYERLDDPVVHERAFRFERASGRVWIVDRLSGRGRHAARWHFHLAPGVSAERSGAAAVTLSAAGRQWRLRLPDGLDVAIRPAEYSPSYGVAVPCLAIDASSTIEIDGERSWELAIEP
jgi:heparinase II/III-like protein